MTVVDPAGVSVYETHIGVVFLIGDRAVKLKKPVRTDFLDFSTREQRERICHREVELNRRLAPQAYLGVADVRGPDGAPCEHMVVMARMPDDRRLSTIVADRRSGAGEVWQVARAVAAFHAGAQRSPRIAAAGRVDAVRQRWEGVLDGLRAAVDELLDRDVVAAIEQLAMRFLSGRDVLFAERIDAGRVVDGHGDLLAEDIFCTADGPQIMDCLEFDDQLRWVDGLDDAAFLAMDLEYNGRPDLADAFLDQYAGYAGDPAPTALAHHYIAYRAAVRAKVAALRAQQVADAGSDPAAAARDQARQHAQLAHRHLERAAVRLVLVGGLPGTGKSTVAGRLAGELGMVVLSSDRIRKELAGLDPAEPAGAEYRSDLYAPDVTERVYRELSARAEALCSRGESVLLDASWSAAAHRDQARAVAERAGADLVELRCRVPAAVAAERLAGRGGSASDADDAVAAAMAADEDAWPQAHEVSTDRTEGETLAAVVDLVAPERVAEPPR